VDDGTPLNPLALLSAYPALRDALPHVPLGEFPTPVKSLPELSARLGIGELYLKDDGPSAAGYGGSKVRKLEFLLGDALRRSARELLTFGYAGSNHTVATAYHARSLGIRTIALLLPQRNAGYVQTNLRALGACGAEVHYYRHSVALALGTLGQLVRHGAGSGRLPVLVPPGGSSPLGMVGLVSAALELKRQVLASELPVPGRLYLAAGSLGITVGLLLGLAVMDLPTRVVAVSVLLDRYVNEARVRRLYRRTNRLLHKADPTFPLLPFPAACFELRREFVGEGYGRPTPEGLDAQALASSLGGIQLDSTYTAKAFAAVVSDARAGRLAGETVLFWFTGNSRNLEALIDGFDFHRLPSALHSYFSSP
jgi:D-cysteine desulfhydrase